MKAFKLIAIAALMICSVPIKAQVSVSVNIGSPPLWGPVGYTEARYYYLPDVEAYYDVESSMFIYYGGGVWVRRAYLPARYRSYDLYSGYKVVMTDYRGNAPYTTYNNYKVKYKKGYRGGNQRTIGSRPGNGNSRGQMSKGHSKERYHEGNRKIVAPRHESHSNSGNMKQEQGGRGGHQGGNGGGHGGGNGKKR